MHTLDPTRPELSFEVALDALDVGVIPRRAVIVADDDLVLTALAIDVDRNRVEVVPEV